MAGLDAAICSGCGRLEAPVRSAAAKWGEVATLLLALLSAALACLAIQRLTGV